MRIRFHRVGLIAVLALLAMPAWAGDGVRELPTAPEMRSAPGTDYLLRTVNFGGATVSLIDVHSGVGDWSRPDAAKLPALPSPPSGKDGVQWFYGEAVGWMAVPTGWHVQRAAVGADATARYTFVAAEGAASGWLTYAVIPACDECLLRAAEALLPDAGEQLAARHDSTAINLGQTNPVMSWQSRPDDCTALFRYRSGGLTVNAAVLSSVPVSALQSGKGALSLADIYVALPASKASLAEYLTGNFRQTFQACRSPQGWAG